MSSFVSGLAVSRQAIVENINCLAQLKLQVKLYKNYKVQQKEYFATLSNEKYLKKIKQTMKILVDEIEMLNYGVEYSNNMFIERMQKREIEHDFEIGECYGMRYDQFVLSSDEVDFVLRVTKS